MAANHVGWSSRGKGRESFAERFWRQRIDQYLSVNYIQEKVVRKKEVGSAGKGNYFLDFFFTEQKIDLEIDGRQHEDRKESDAIRDKLLTDHGIKVIRYKWPKGDDRFMVAHKQFESFAREFYDVAL